MQFFSYFSYFSSFFVPVAFLTTSITIDFFSPHLLVVFIFIFIFIFGQTFPIFLDSTGSRQASFV
jgi:hypothetical protein